MIAALFESWLYPLIIMLSVPLGAVGGFVGLWLLELLVQRLQPLDMFTMVGFIILVGTVVNNPILIVEQALQNMREEGMDPRDAILDSVRTPHSADLHDGADRLARPVAAGHLARCGQRTLSRPRQRDARRPRLLDVLHAVLHSRAVHALHGNANRR